MLIKKLVSLVTRVPLVTGRMTLILEIRISFLLRLKVNRNTVRFAKGKPVLEVSNLVHTLS